ncbi:putative Extracellular metalloproteinase [Seiridium cardinale]|uniref:Extracellular metalloproteinase n=1 Tax=Seiridium cardinale TaxID=138064 RepID=A0ABR2XJI2_9PEZI
MRYSLLASVVIGASLTLAHPHAVDHRSAYQGGLNKRSVDLNQYRTGTTNLYKASSTVKTDDSLKVLKRADYVETATELVKSTFPDAEFRVANSYVGTNGVGHVYFKQTVHGLDIDNSDFNVNIGKDGHVFSYGNNFFTGEIPADSPLSKRDFVDPTSALTGATSILSLPVTGDASAEAIEGTEAYVLKGTSGAQKDPEARLMYYVKQDGTLALTWRVETDIMDNWLLTYVDAESNDAVHGVVDYVAEATYTVFPWACNDPDECSRTTLTNPWNTTESPLTWLNDGTTTYHTTRGNNAIAQTNPSGGNTYLNNYRPTSAQDAFEYEWTATMTPPTTYRDASVTQLFFTGNEYHDLLYTLGFNEDAGNFQIDNQGKGGSGSDFTILNSQDGSGTNNANFATPPDGQPGRMRMYLWTQSTPVRDCAFEAGVIIHEYSHGLSTRLTGGPANSNCLNALEAGGMGEGWGDFMATAIRLKPSDTRKTNYPMGAWVYNNPAGIRSVLFSTSLTTNPNTYTTLNTKNEVHDIGETWTTMLYEVLWNLIDKHGKNDSARPTFDANGVPTDGKFLTMKLVIDAMALQPCNPNFVTARDAILDADEALTGGDNACEIWTGFAKRGLGQGAKYGASKNRVASKVIPTGVC